MRCLFPRSDTSYINRAPHLQVSHFIWNSEITKKMTNFWYPFHIGFNIKLPCEDSNGIWSLILFLFFLGCWMLVDVWQCGSSVCLLISRLNLRPKSRGRQKFWTKVVQVTTIKTATSPSSLLCKRCFNQKGEIKLWEFWVRLVNETYRPAPGVICSLNAMIGWRRIEKRGGKPSRERIWSEKEEKFLEKVNTWPRECQSKSLL